MELANTILWVVVASIIGGGLLIGAANPDRLLGTVVLSGGSSADGEAETEIPTDALADRAVDGLDDAGVHDEDGEAEGQADRSGRGYGSDDDDDERDRRHGHHGKK